MRRQRAETFGAPAYCKRGRDGIDDLLEARLPADGVYIEAGAIDGFSASNTYYLDRVKGWSGILVEPNQHQSAACKRFRKRAQVFHCALVPFDFEGESVTITYGNDLTWTEGAYEGDELAERNAMLEGYGLSGHQMEVPARSIQSILDEVGVEEVTLFSLDVEGFEVPVLQGLDFGKNPPRYLLIECQTEKRLQEIRAELGDRYDQGEQLTRHDYFFSRVAG